MEIFGILILLAAKAVSNIGPTEAFYIAAVVAIACGLVGDVMNDFKAGYILSTDSKSQWIAEVVGGIIGGFTSVIILAVILKAYGGEAFGSEMFPAAQASAVAALARYKAPMESAYGKLSAETSDKISNMNIITLGHNVMYQGSSLNGNSEQQKRLVTGNILNIVWLFDDS